MATSRVLQTPLFGLAVKALQLAGMGDRTQQCYARAVRKLLEFYPKDPKQISVLPHQVPRYCWPG